MNNTMTRYKAFLTQCEKLGYGECQKSFSDWFLFDSITYADVINDIRALDGKIFAMLNQDERLLLDFFSEQGRKYGVSISIITPADIDDLANVTSKEQLEAIYMTVNCKVSVAYQPPIHDEYYLWAKPFINY